jgi:hypothetical protein
VRLGGAGQSWSGITLALKNVFQLVPLCGHVVITLCASVPAALGDVGRAELAEQLARAIVSHPPEQYRAQELSNAVYALGTLGVLCEDALDALLEAVSGCAPYGHAQCFAAL